MCLSSSPSSSSSAFTPPIAHTPSADATIHMPPPPAHLPHPGGTRAQDKLRAEIAAKKELRAATQKQLEDQTQHIKKVTQDATAMITHARHIAGSLTVSVPQVCTVLCVCVCVCVRGGGGNMPNRPGCSYYPKANKLQARHAQLTHCLGFCLTREPGSCPSAGCIWPTF